MASASRPASFLVQQARQWVGVYDRSRLRDGFEEDKGQADVDVISALNWANRELTRTGQYKCYFSLPMTAEVAQYDLDPEIGTIIVATFAVPDTSTATGLATRPLAKTRITSLDIRYPSWRDAHSGVPVAYFTDVPDVIGLFPPPDTTDAADAPSLTLLAEVVASDLVYPTDTPLRLPVQFHEDLSVGAAMRLAFSFGLLDKFAILSAMWAQIVRNVQEDAQHREQDESVQMVANEVYRSDNGYIRQNLAFYAGTQDVW